MGYDDGQMRVVTVPVTGIVFATFRICVVPYIETSLALNQWRVLASAEVRRELGKKDFSETLSRLCW